MSTSRWVSAVAIAGLAAVAAPGAAPAAPLAPITGTLDKPGYTLIAMSAAGEARTAVAPTGAFSLVPSAALVTLQLRAPDGSYAGPVVLAEQTNGVARARAAVAKAQHRVVLTRRALARARHTGPRAVRQARARLTRARAALTRARRTLTAARRDAAARPTRAVLGVRAGQRLGAVAIQAAGYARTRALGDRAWTVHATGGVPLAAGNLGLVRSPASGGAALRDRDLDGAPDALDVDDDGDLVLDDYDTSSATARAAQAGRTQFSDGSHLQAVTALGAFSSEDAVNADGGSTDEQIFASERRQGVLEFLWTGLDEGSGEIDCGALSYCSAGGTGAFGLNSVPPGGSRDNVQPFPASFDADGDGFGSLVRGGPSPAMVAPGGQTMGIYHGASAEEIQAGDVLIEKGTVGGLAQESATALGFVFATYPVLAAYDDGQGDSGQFTYPNSGAPVPVRAGPGGDIVLRLTFWRPQRLRLADEPGTGRWMDVGNLAWTMYGGGGSMHPNCQQSDLSDPSDTLRALTASPMPGQDSLAGGYQDVMGDQPASAANTLSFTLNLSACLAHTSSTFAVGNTHSTAVTAVASGRDGNLFFTTSWINLRRVG